MFIDLNQPGVVCIQQKVRGTGVFNGTTPVGWALLPYASGGVVGSFRSRERGVAGNACTIRLLNPGKLTPASTMRVSGSAVTVTLKHDGAAITALASEVATLLASYDDATSTASGRVRSPVLFGVTTDGVMAALATTALTGGIDPTLDGGIYKTLQTNNTNGGLFAFYSPEPVEVLQIDGSGTLTSVVIANVDDGFNVVAGESSDVSAVYTASSLLLGGNQALLVSMAAAGVVRVWVRRASRRQ